MTDSEYQKLLADERTRVATAAAGLPKGSGTVYLAAEGGERMKQGVRSMFGMEEPVVTAQKKKEARQELLNSILGQFTNMETRADYISAINMGVNVAPPESLSTAFTNQMDTKAKKGSSLGNILGIAGNALFPGLSGLFS